jgi:hypothetical protein
MPHTEESDGEWRLLIYDTTKQRDRQLLRRFLKTSGVWRSAAKRLFNILFDTGCDNGLKCQSVVVETQYVDRDYADAYGKLYGRSFHTYRRFPYRLHFLAQPLESGLELHIDSLTSEKERWQALQDKYLGFAVIRPSIPDTIGRAVILPPCSRDHNCFILCQNEFDLNLAGLPLKARGCAFMEQDGMVGACATAAVWMAHMTLYKRRGLPTFSTTSITELADATYPSPQRVFPSEGLSIEQIGVAMKRMGHETIAVDLGATSKEEVKRWLYYYVESGIPIVLGVETPDGTHAITLVGHTLKSPLTQESVEPILEFDDSYFYLASDWAEEFVMHDDQRGPYHLVKVVAGKETSSAIEVQDLPKRPIKNRRFDIVGGVVPLPQHVYLSAEDALTKAIITLEFIREESGIPLRFMDENRVVLRHFLIDSNKFKSNSDTVARGMSRTFVLLNQKRHLPQYLWLTEISTLSKWNTAVQDRRVIGEILVDPTSNPSHLDCLSAHISGNFWYAHPQDRDLSDMLRHEPIIVSNWTPYKPISRPVS